MAISKAFDVSSMLAFYGAYHSNKINIAIHMVFVPLILWTAQVLLKDVPLPSFIPHIQHVFNQYLIFDLNFPTITMAAYLAYYFILEPVAAILYTPQMIISVLSATAFSRKSDAMTIAGAAHVVSWIAQFMGHGLAEGRAPALLDNLLGAIVLAPFFVHLEILFHLGYRPAMYKKLKNDVGKEITKLRKDQGDARRAQQAKSQ